MIDEPPGGDGVSNRDGKIAVGAASAAKRDVDVDMLHIGTKHERVACESVD